MIHPIAPLVPEVGEVVHQAPEVEFQADQVVEVALLVAQSKAAPPVEVQAVQAVQVAEVALQVVREKVALKERVHHDD